MQLVDKDGSGFLDEGEVIPIAVDSLKTVINIQDGAQQFEPKITQAEVKRFMQIFDRDKNGVLTLEEFSGFMKFSICRAWIEHEYQVLSRAFELCPSEVRGLSLLCGARCQWRP